MQPISDTDIIPLLKNGDHTAYTRLFEQHWQMVFNIAYKKIGDEQDALDIVQEVFAGIWEKRSQLTVEGAVAPWLSGIVKHKVIDWYRLTNKRAAQKEALLLHLQAVASTSYEGHNIYDKAQAQWLQAVGQLPEQMKKIYLLHQVEGVSIPDIAAQLSLQPQSVKNQLSKATTRLRESLLPHLTPALLLYLVTIR